MNETLLSYLISHVDNLPKISAPTPPARQWSEPDKFLLLHAVKEQHGSSGGICWQTVADQLEGRSARCCRCQYYAIMRGNKYLRQQHGIKKAIKWSTEDSERIEQMVLSGVEVNQIISTFTSYSKYQIRNKINYIKIRQRRDGSQRSVAYQDASPAPEQVDK